MGVRGTTVRDLDGQRSLTIDAREKTVFIDADGFCYEIDRGMLLHALRKEFATALACLACQHALVVAA